MKHAISDTENVTNKQIYWKQQNVASVSEAFLESVDLT